MAAPAGAVVAVRPDPAVDDLLADAAGALLAAAATTTPAERLLAAHRAALRAACAVLAARAAPEAGSAGPPGRTRRRRPTSVWVLLVRVAPGLQEWAALFEQGSAHRAAVRDGRRACGSRQADDLLRDTEAFLSVVTGLLGRGAQPVLPGTVAACRPGGGTGG